jgi:hypothetical protein
MKIEAKAMLPNRLATSPEGGDTDGSKKQFPVSFIRK